MKVMDISLDGNFDDIQCNLFPNSHETQIMEKLPVFVRIRPLLQSEETKGYKVSIQELDGKKVQVIVPHTSSYKSSNSNDGIIEQYTFTSTFGPEIGQFVFFQETMSNTMEHFLKGGNSLIFNYGITGSGKTYTLQGNSDNPGVIPLSLHLFFSTNKHRICSEVIAKPMHYDEFRILSDADKKKYFERREGFKIHEYALCENAPRSFRTANSKSFAVSLCNYLYDEFDSTEQQETLSLEKMAAVQAVAQLKETCQKIALNQLGRCNVWVSFVEIYNEVIYDLLRPLDKEKGRPRLKLEGENGDVYVKGAVEVCVQTYDEALKLLNFGRKNLSVSSTKMNHESSRSHCIYTIRLVHFPDPNNLSNGKVNRLSFCDLAGSERVAKTQATGIELKEAGSINTSLFVLGKCFEQLRQNNAGKEKLIPYRESKLTRLFSGIFLNKIRAVMITNVSPADYTIDETLHVLKFAALARKILVTDSSQHITASTLKDITYAIETSKANNSSILNESTDSIDSCLDPIEFKDKLIQKLMDLVIRLKNEQEKCNNENIELKRKNEEILQDSAAYSDILLENQRKIFEQARNQREEQFKNHMLKVYKEVKHNFDDVGEGLDTILQQLKTAPSSNLDESRNESQRYSSSFLSDSDLLNDSEKENAERDSNEADLISKINLLNNELKSVKDKMRAVKSDLEFELIIVKEEYKQKLRNIEASSVHFKNKIKNLEDELMSVRKQPSLTESTSCDISKLKTDIHMRDKKIESLEEELKLANEARGTDEKEIGNYRALIDKFQEKLSSLQKDYYIVKEESEPKSTADCALETEIHIFNKKIESLQEELKLASEARVTAEKEIENYKSSITELQIEVSSIQKDCYVAKQENQQKSSAYLALERDLDLGKSEIKKLEETLESANKMKKETENELSVLKINLQTAKENLDHKSKIISNLESDVDKYKSEIRNLEKTVESANKMKEETENELSVLKINLQTAEENLDHKSKIISNLESDIDLCKSEIRKLEKTVESANKMKEETENELSVLKINLQTAEENLDHKSKIISNLESEIESFKKGKKEFAKSLELRLMKDKTEKHMKSLEKQLLVSKEKLQSEIKNLQEKKQKLEKENAEYILSNYKYENDAEEHKKNVSKLENEIKNLQEKKLILEKENAEYILRHSELENSTEEHEKKSSKLKNDNSDNSSYSQEIEKLQNIIEKKDCEILDHKNGINELQEKLSLLMKEEQVKIIDAELEQFSTVNDVISDYKNKLAKVQEMLLMTTEEMNAGKTEITEKLQELSKLENEILIYKDKLDASRNENKKMSLKLSNVEKDYLMKIENLKEQLNSEREMCLKCQTNLKETEERLHAAISENTLSENRLTEEKQQLQDELAEVMEEFKTYQSRISELEAEKTLNNKLHSPKIQEKSLSLSQLKCDISPWSIEVENLKNEISVYKNNNTELQKKLSSTIDALNAERIKAEENSLQLSKLRDEISNCKGKLDEVQAKLSAASSEKQNEILVFKEKLHALTNDNNEKIQQISDLKYDISSWSIEVENLKNEISVYKNNNTELQEKLSSTIDALNAERIKAEDSSQQLSVLKEISNCKGKLDEVQAKLSAASSAKPNEISVFKEKLHALTNDNNEKIRHISELEYEKQQLYEELSKRNLEITEYKERIGELEAKEALKSDELLAVKKEIEELSSKLSKLTCDVNSYLQEIKILKSDIVKSDGEKTELHNKIAVLDDSRDELQKELESVNAKLADKVVDVNAYLQQIETLNSIIEKSDVKQSKLLNDIDVLNDKNSELQKELESVHEMLISAENKCQEVEKFVDVSPYLQEIQTLKIIIEKSDVIKSELLNAIDVLKDKNSELQKELESVREMLISAENKYQEVEKIVDVNPYLQEIQTLKIIIEKSDVKKSELLNDIDVLKEKNIELQKELESVREMLILAENKFQEVEKVSVSAKTLDVEICEKDGATSELGKKIEKEDCVKLYNEKQLFQTDQNKEEITEIENIVSIEKECENLKQKEHVTKPRKIKQEQLFQTDQNKEEITEIENIISIEKECENLKRKDHVTKSRKIKQEQLFQTDQNKEEITEIENIISTEIECENLKQKEHVIKPRKIKQEPLDDYESSNGLQLELYNNYFNIKTEEVEPRPERACKTEARKSIEKMTKQTRRSTDNMKINSRETSRRKVYEKPIIKKIKVEAPSDLECEEVTTTGISTRKRNLRNIHEKPSVKTVQLFDSKSEETTTPRTSNRKRISEDDFIPPDWITKKIKQEKEEVDQVSKRTSRRRPVNPPEGRSPIQKFASVVGAKIRNVAQSVANIASPRVTTRRQVKLFNPDASSSVTTRRAARERK